MIKLMQNAKFINALPPVAEAYESGPNSTDIINMANWETCTFIVTEGVGTTGTSTITVLACDDTTPTTSAACSFRYKAITTIDTEGDTTLATTAGFGTTAGSNHMYLVEVSASDLPSNYQYVKLKHTELVDAAVLSGTIAILTGGSDQGDDLATAIV